jgi:hypothetical protein
MYSLVNTIKGQVAMILYIAKSAFDCSQIACDFEFEFRLVSIGTKLGMWV